MERSNLIIAFLCGVCVALGTALLVNSGDTLPKAHAQSAGGGQLFAVTGTGYSGQGRDVVFVVDSTNQTMAVYEYKNNKLNVAAIRNLEYDMQVPTEYPPRSQKPSVSDIKKALGGKKAKKRRR